MAKATIKGTRKFTLKLSEREALAVQTVIAHTVSGASDDDSLGTDAFAVMNELFRAGLDYFDHPANETVSRDPARNLVFGPYPKGLR